MARKGNMFDKTIKSEFLKEEMVVKIYEPAETDPLYENNVCIMQDGDDYFQLGRVATVSDKLHEKDDIINTTFVGIHYIDRFDRLKKYHPDGEQFEAYIRFLTKEVVPLLDEVLPLNPLGTIRTLMGDSLAGTLALMTALRHPDIFQKVIMQSPLVDDKVLKAAEKSEGIRGLEVYHSIGLKEDSVPTTKDGRVDFLKPNKQLFNILTEKLTTYHYKEIEDGNHTWKFWQKELPSVLKQMLS